MSEGLRRRVALLEAAAGHPDHGGFAVFLARLCRPGETAPTVTGATFRSGDGAVFIARHPGEALDVFQRRARAEALGDRAGAAILALAYAK